MLTDYLIADYMICDLKPDQIAASSNLVSPLSCCARRRHAGQRRARSSTLAWCRRPAAASYPCISDLEGRLHAILEARSRPCRAMPNHGQPRCPSIGAAHAVPWRACSLGSGRRVACHIDDPRWTTTKKRPGPSRAPDSVTNDRVVFLLRRAQVGHDKFRGRRGLDPWYYFLVPVKGPPCTYMVCVSKETAQSWT